MLGRESFAGLFTLSCLTSLKKHPIKELFTLTTGTRIHKKTYFSKTNSYKDMTFTSDHKNIVATNLYSHQ